MTFLVRKPSTVAPKAKFYYPRALVVLTVTIDALDDSTPPEATTYEVAVKPMGFRVTRNSYQAPDEFSAEMDIRALPITPKQIRRCTVGIFLWSAREAGPPLDADGNYIHRPLFEGIVNEVTASYEDGGHTVSISGEDYTSLFTRKQWDSKRRMPAGRRLDIHLAELIKEAQPNGLITLRVEPEDLRLELPVVGAKAIRTNKKGKPVTEKSSWWDVMYKMALVESCILFVEGNEVVLTRPNRLHESRAGGAATSSSGRPVYSFAWGRNITRLEIQRNFGKEMQPVIKAVGHDLRGPISATYPKRKDTAGRKFNVDFANEELATPFEGVTSVEALQLYARLLFELRAKGEQSIAIGTEDLTDLNGADVLPMRAGDAAGIDIDVFNTAELLRADEGTRLKQLLALKFPTDAAQYIAHNMDVVDQLKGPFRVRSVSIDFSADDGVSIDAELQDFVRLEEDA